MPAGRRAAEVWLRHPLLDRAPGGTPYGANSTEIHGGALWIGNPSQKLLLSVPIGRDGRPGDPVVRRQGPMFADVDDFDLESDGTTARSWSHGSRPRRSSGRGRTAPPPCWPRRLTGFRSRPRSPSTGAGVYVTNAAFFRPPDAALASVQVLR